jgi:cell wall-associated NlpC family hydrolase
VQRAANVKPNVKPNVKQGLVVLLLCAALGAVSLQAAHGRGAGDPAGAVVAAARSHLGDPYRWGADGPRAFDCSGLVLDVWSRVGRVARIPRTAALQQAWAVPIPAQQARPADLVFFGDPVSHVGLVTGRAGGSLQMIDASASHHGVVRRTVWRSGVVRFGRVPRRGMPRVRPWRLPQPHPAPLVSPREPALHGRRPLAGLSAHPPAPSRKARRFAALARRQVGARRWTDDSLVTVLWRRAGGTTSPASRTAIRNRTHRVLLPAARAGDVVVYPSPAGHVGIYLGRGWMIDASRSLHRVVLRPVWAAPGVQLVRWSG